MITYLSYPINFVNIVKDDVVRFIVHNDIRGNKRLILNLKLRVLPCFIDADFMIDGVADMVFRCGCFDSTCFELELVVMRRSSLLCLYQTIWAKYVVAVCWGTFCLEAIFVEAGNCAFIKIKHLKTIPIIPHLIQNLEPSSILYFCSF